MPDLIAPAARAAYNTATVAEKAAAIDAIAAVLGGSVPRASLSVAFTDPVQRMLVITDGTTHLAAVHPVDVWEVWLVAKIDAQWTRKAKVTTLIELGKALA